MSNNHVCPKAPSGEPSGDVEVCVNKKDVLFNPNAFPLAAQL